MPTPSPSGSADASSRSRIRAGVVVTGTEVLTGRVSDANGPWLADQLRQLGVDVGQVVVVGDRPEDLAGALGFLAATNDLVITTGGLGPTADDLTARVVGDFQGRESHLDRVLEQEIADIVARLSAARGWEIDPEVSAAAVRKQALVPDGAHALAPVGTAPGLVVPVAEGRAGPPVLVLPGPPGELQGMWDDALTDTVVASVLEGASELRQATVRLFGTPEAELAATLRRVEEQHPGASALEVTTCLTSGGELEIVTRFAPDAQPAYDALVAAVADDYPATMFSNDGRTVDEIVADGLLDVGGSIATAESCTAGLLAGRLADRPGSSAYLMGGLVTYDNAAKRDLAGVPQQLIDSVGAVSAEVAQAMADGARARLGTTIGVGITGVAGPGGGTADKPVGLVHVCVSSQERCLGRELRLGGSRARIRERTVAEALHLVRRFLAEAAEESQDLADPTGAAVADGPVEPAAADGAPTPA